MRRLVGLAALLASTALGVALYAVPDVLGLAAGARANWLVTGPLAAAAATISLSPVARSTVRVNVLLGAWLDRRAARAGLRGVVVAGHPLRRGAGPVVTAPAE